MAGKFYEPQTPLMQGGDFYYPITTAGQVIMPDGQRLNGVGVYLDKPDETDDTTLEAGINADTLGGVLATDYALKTDTIENAVNATNAENFSGYTVDALKAYILDLAHPIGSYYWSSENTSPSTLFGGTWTSVNGRFVLASSSSYEVGSTGGAATVTITENQMPSHSHEENFTYSTSDARPFGVINSSDYTASTQVTNGTYKLATITQTFTTASASNPIYPIVTEEVGGGKAHNNMPPYIVAYCWRRTA